MRPSNIPQSSSSLIWVFSQAWIVLILNSLKLRQAVNEYSRVSAETSDRATALAKSQRELRNSKNYQHPCYLASFVLMGANRSVPGKALGARA